MRKKERKHRQHPSFKMRLLICAAVMFGLAVQEMKYKLFASKS